MFKTGIVIFVFLFFAVGMFFLVDNGYLEVEEQKESVSLKEFWSGLSDGGTEEDRADNSDKVRVDAEKVVGSREIAPVAESFPAPSKAAGLDRDSALNSLVFVEADRGRKTAFAARSGNERFLYTNQHSLVSENSLSFLTGSGLKLTCLSVEIAGEQDIARLRFRETDKVPALNFETSTVSLINAPVSVAAAGSHRSRTGFRDGSVVAVGKGWIDLSSSCCVENSGGPVLERLNGRVIGVCRMPSYTDYPEWMLPKSMRRGSRAAEAELVNVQTKWTVVDAGVYQEQGRLVADGAVFLKGCYEVAQQRWHDVEDYVPSLFYDHSFSSRLMKYKKSIASSTTAYTGIMKMEEDIAKLKKAYMSTEWVSPFLRREAENAYRHFVPLITQKLESLKKMYSPSSSFVSKRTTNCSNSKCRNGWIIYKGIHEYKVKPCSICNPGARTNRFCNFDGCTNGWVRYYDSHTKTWQRRRCLYCNRYHAGF